MNKTGIKNFAIWARNKLIADISYRAGLMGITADGIQKALPQSTGMENGLRMKILLILQRQDTALTRGMENGRLPSAMTNGMRNCRKPAGLQAVCA